MQIKQREAQWLHAMVLTLSSSCLCMCEHVQEHASDPCPTHKAI